MPSPVDLPGAEAAPAQFLQAFLTGEPAARRGFPRAWGARLRRLARDLSCEINAQSLVEDADVEQETWASLLDGKPERFQPDRGAAAAFLRLEVRNALTRARARLRPPGARSRDLRAVPSLSLDDAVGLADGDVVRLADVVPDPARDPEARYAQQELVALVLERADPETRRALEQFLSGEAATLSAAAVAAGLSRYAMRRRLKALAIELGDAA